MYARLRFVGQKEWDANVVCLEIKLATVLVSHQKLRIEIVSVLYFYWFWAICSTWSNHNMHEEREQHYWKKKSLSLRSFHGS